MNQQKFKQLLVEVKRTPSNDKKWELLIKLLEDFSKTI